MGLSYSYAHRIGWGECDSAGIVHYPYFYRWFDQGTHEVMRKAGWTVIRVWEHEDVEAASDRVEVAVRTPLCQAQG